MSESNPAALPTLLEKLKRHSVYVRRADPEDPCSQIEYVAMPPDPHGPWVGFADVEAALLASGVGIGPSDRLRLATKIREAARDIGAYESLSREQVERWAERIENAEPKAGVGIGHE